MIRELCQAGREYKFGGKWLFPCCDPVIHQITWPGGSPILLCEKHFHEAAANGLVKDVNIGEDEFARREESRTKIQEN